MSSELQMGSQTFYLCMIKNEPAYVINNLSATCNLMSEQVFDRVFKRKLELLKTCRKVYTYTSQEPLKLSGKCTLNICVPDTQTSFKADHEFLFSSPLESV